MKQVVSQTQRRSDVASNDNPSSKGCPSKQGKRKERRTNSRGSWKAPTVDGIKKENGENVRKKERRKGPVREEFNRAGSWKLRMMNHQTTNQGSSKQDLS
jgi:hypothetical protein